MSFVPGFEHDVFISYSHLDNMGLDEGMKGWVDTFQERLGFLLTQQLGTRPSIWHDGRDSLPHDQIFQAHLHLLSSAVFVAVVSPAYVKSEWCMAGLNEFYRQANLKVGGWSRIINVTKMHVPYESLPPGLSETLSYNFYEYDAEMGRPREFSHNVAPARDIKYWDILRSVAYDISQLLEQMVKLPPAAAKPPETTAPPSPPARAVPTVSDSPAGTATLPPKRDQVFISYSRKDAKWLERLQVHLKPLEQLGSVTRWDDTLIKPGAKWREEIKEGLAAAKVAVLIISADFLASDFIMKNELPPMLAAAEKEGATILPLIVSPCRFEGTPGLSDFQSVNSPSQPLAVMTKARREAVFVRLVQAIESALRS